jgi:hypothetical protein
MDGNNFADLFGTAGTGFNGRFYRRHITPHDSRNVATASFLIPYQLHAGGFYHCVRRFHHGGKAATFDHS